MNVQISPIIEAMKLNIDLFDLDNDDAIVFDLKKPDNE